MSCDVACCQVIKLEYILDKFLFLVVDCAFFTADIHHNADGLFADLLIVCLRIDPQQPKDCVGGNGQQPNDGGKELCDRTHHGGHAEGKRFRCRATVVIGKPFTPDPKQKDYGLIADDILRRIYALKEKV